MSEELMKLTFSTNLKYYMKSRGINQSDIIRDLKVPSATISSWVNGKRLPRMSKIQELANYLGVTKSDLIEHVIIGTFSSETDAEEFTKDIEKDPSIIFSDDRSLYKANPNTLFEFINNNDFSDEELEYIKHYAEFVKSRRDDYWEKLKGTLESIDTKPKD